MTWFFLLSGIFLGWSLGSNNAANVFGTAVGTKMVRFKVAAIVASVFVIIGAVISGAGAAHTLGRLGAVNAIAGSFTVALAAAVTVAWMTKLSLPASATQAIVGAIVGWDLFSGALIDTGALSKILATWVICPVLSGVFAYIIYKIVVYYLKVSKIHLLEMDLYTRIGLVLIGAFGSYSLGANNIANVMGVFVTANPFKDLNLFNIYRITGTQILFLFGGLAIALGIYTYSYKVMKTVGKDLFKLSPSAALVVVFAESLVLFIFASESLQKLLLSAHLPSIPLVPVSSAQAVVGGVIGVAIARGGGRAVNYKMLTKIFSGWVTTPVAAGIISFFTLFFVQNVFQLRVFNSIPYAITEKVAAKLASQNLWHDDLSPYRGTVFQNARKFKYTILRNANKSRGNINKILEYSEIDSFIIDSSVAEKELDPAWFSKAQINAVKKLHGSIFAHKWELVDTLSSLSDSWKFKPNTAANRLYNKGLKKHYAKLYVIFNIDAMRAALQHQE